MGPTWQPTRLANPRFYVFDKLFKVERRLGTRGWNIDPIVDYLNHNSERFVCDTFVSESELLSRPVDIVFICKTFDDLSLQALMKLKKKGVKFVYSIVDNSHKEAKCYLDHPEYMELMDHFILHSPLQEQDISQFEKPFSLLLGAVINTKHKLNYEQEGPLCLVWNGFKENLQPMEALYPVVKDVANQIGIPMEIVLNTNLPESRTESVHIVPWSIESWEDVMVSSDIAVVIKERDDFFQSRKPATKVMTFMAAGLPTICTPTVADELVIRQGETAYAAYSEADWRRFLVELGTSMDRRKKMGEAAQESIVSRFSIAQTAHEHELIFDSLLREPAYDTSDLETAI